MVIKKLASESNIHSCLNFVACEHPDFDPGLLEGDDCCGDIVLEFVLDGGRANQGHSSFNLCTDVLNELFALCTERVESRGKLGRPCLVLALTEVLFREHERA